MDVTISAVGADGLGAVAEAIARWQAEPTTHITYMSVEPGPIAEDLRTLEPAGLDAALAAWRNDDVVGFLAAEWDLDPPRVWWHGPFVDPGLSCRDDLADVLYERLRLSLPRQVEQEELASDDRHTTMASFAERHGFKPIDDPSAVLVLRPGVDAVLSGEVKAEIADLSAADRRAVSELHESTFPGTHTSGLRLSSGEHHEVICVAKDEGIVAGYVAAERQADGSGYIDFLGVAESHRGRGLGRALVVRCVQRLRTLGCEEISLTVRESNRVARRLYTSIGFDEERIIMAWRKGF